ALLLRQQAPRAAGGPRLVRQRDECRLQSRSRTRAAAALSWNPSRRVVAACSALQPAAALRQAVPWVPRPCAQWLGIYFTMRQSPGRLPAGRAARCWSAPRAPREAALNRTCEAHDDLFELGVGRDVGWGEKNGIALDAVDVASRGVADK